MTPDHYHDLSAALHQSWDLIEQGVTNRRHGFHNPVVATIGLDGRPRARTVILRSADKIERKLVFHTDARSEKIIEFTADSRVSMHFYDVASKAQIRIEGFATLHIQNAFAQKRWDMSLAMSRMCYAVQPAPGTQIECADGYTMNGIEIILPPNQTHDFENFAAVEISVTRLEWLFLAQQGHRRAVFKWTETGEYAQSWLVP